MPKLGLTMTEGMIAEWLVGPGDQVNVGDVMFVVETDKVATEIVSDDEGIVGEILVQVGETVPVGAVIGTWTGPAQGIQEEPESNQDDRDANLISNSPDESQQTSHQPLSEERVVATPLARRIATEFSVDLERVEGRGPNQRIRAQDVRDYVDEQHKSSDKQQQTLPEFKKSVSKVQNTVVVPASNLIKVMAQRMVEAKQVPHFYLSAEAEVSELLVLRERLNQDDSYLKLTLNHFVIAAVARALELVPQQNRIWTEEGIVEYQQIDIGVAVSTDKGLMAPVLHDLGGRSLDAIASESNEVIGRVREGQAQRNDMEGGAITISNAGMFNVTYMTPIINPPHSAIVGVGSIREVFRPDEQGVPCLKKEMGLVLAADHRLHDGATGLVFLNCVIDLLQNPYKLLRTAN